MIVTIVSKYDYAGSGKRIVDAVKKSDNSIDIVSFVEHEGQGSEVIRLETGQSILNYGEKKFIERLKASDIIHFKGDWYYGNQYKGLELRQKKIIYTFGGSMFRRKTKDYYPNEICRGNSSSDLYTANLLSALTPDLCYNERIVLAPHAYNDFDYQFKKSDKIRVMHIPSSPFKKGSDIIYEALSQFDDIDLVFESNISHARSLELKKSCHLYIDQMIVPVYGNAAIEAMAFGIPVLNWDENLYPFKTPIIKPKTRDMQGVYDAVNKVLDWKILEDLSFKTFEYANNIHGKMGERWVKIYKEL